MYTTLIILLVTAVLFAVGRVRSDIIALCALICLLLTGNLTTSEALSGFSNPVVIMMAGLFIVGGAVLQTGLAKKIGGKITSLAGNSELKLFLLVMVFTSAIGGFVSNTGTVALMLPIIVSMASSSGISSRRILMPLAFASSMGGMLTLIGTPPNLVIQETLVESGYSGLGFFTFLPVGLIAVAVGIVVLLPLSKWFLKEKQGDVSSKRGGKSLSQLVSEYGLTDNLSVYRVKERSRICGMTIGKLNIYNMYGVSIIEVRRETGSQHGILKNVVQKMAAADTMLDVGDLLFVNGDQARARAFAKDFSLETVNAKNYGRKSGLDFYDLGIAEILLMQDSKIVGRKVKDCGFREKYCLNVIGLRRHGEYKKDGVADMKIMSGDVLLVQGVWNDIARLTSEDEQWVVLGQPLAEAAKVTLDYKAPVAAAVMVAMVAMMVFDFIPVAPVTAVLIAAVLMILTGCFRTVEAAYKTINWESIVLIAAMMPMSVALTNTGASALVSQSLVNALGTFGPYALLAGIYFTTSLLTMFISNTATAVLMAPIAMSAASSVGIAPHAFLFAVTVAASMCFASPFSTPPNALVMQAGRYTFMDYIRVGLPLQVIMGVVMVFVLPLLFPF